MQKTIQGFLTIVMPVYNEEAVIEKVMSDFAPIVEQFSKHEYIIVDDGSTDTTLQVLHRMQDRYSFLSIMRNQENRGHAQSLLKGLQTARGDFIFCCDSDNQFYADDFWMLWSAMEEKRLDIALGYRPLRKDPLHRLFIAWLLRFFIFFTFGMRIRDSASSFRLYTRDALRSVLSVIPVNPFFIFPMMSIAGYKRSLRVQEVSVRHLPRTTGITYIRHWNIISICFQAARELVAFKRKLYSPKS